jgi:hypothetical protein
MHQPLIHDLNLRAIAIAWQIKLPLGDSKHLFYPPPEQWLILQGNEAIAVVTRFQGRWSLMSRRLGIHGMPCHSVEYAIEACVVALLRRGWR